MAKETKPLASKEDTFDKLDIRVGRIVEVELETSTPKPTYKMTVDFAKFGKRVSFGRFTSHSIEGVRLTWNIRRA